MEILITEKEIKDATARIAKEISALKLDDLVLLFVLKGGMYFGVDLSREITTPHEVSTIELKSYVGTKSGKITLSGIPKKDMLKNKNVIVVEDIIDTNNTLNFILNIMKKKFETKSVMIASLLYKEKKSTLLQNIKYFIGFNIDDHFVVGNGLDFNQQCRHYKNIRIFKKTPKAV